MKVRCCVKIYKETILQRNKFHTGSLLTDFTPPVNPPQLIDDNTDVKPVDWDEREKIPDPDAKKPDDWNEDEPSQIPDASIRSVILIIQLKSTKINIELIVNQMDGWTMKIP